MQEPPGPSTQAERIRALHKLLLLDTAAEECFNIITCYCRHRFGVEITLVRMVDIDRQWFKSVCGVGAKQIPRDISLCSHTILQDEIMIVSDALLDARFYDDPLVGGPPFIRFYAGVPLKLSNGHVVGTLCLLDSKPKHMEDEEKEHLAMLARLVSMELEHQEPIEGCQEHCIYGFAPLGCSYRNAQCANQDGTLVFT